jgi:hypothetical protein
MAGLPNQPATVNFLSPVGFKLIIDRAPGINYFVQSITMPSVDLGQLSAPTPFSRVQLAGDHVTYSNLGINFKVDEQMANYLEILSWINSLGFPDSFDQSADRSIRFPTAEEKPICDIRLVILSSSKNPVKEIVFKEAYPTALTSLTFQTTVMDIDYIECTATFAFRTFYINNI